MYCVYVCMYVYVYIYVYIYIYIYIYAIMKTMCPPGYHVHHVPKCMSCHKAIVVITGGGDIVFMIAYILRSSCFCEI